MLTLPDHVTYRISGRIREEGLPEAYCYFCSEETPHLYQRLAVNGHLPLRTPQRCRRV